MFFCRNDLIETVIFIFRMKSDSDSTSTDEDLIFEEIHYGDILSRRTRRRRLRGKFVAKHRYFSSVSSYSNMSSPEKDNDVKNIPAIYFDPYDSEELQEDPKPYSAVSRNPSIDDNIHLNKGLSININYKQFLTSFSVCLLL